MTPEQWIVFILQVSPAILALIKQIEAIFGPMSDTEKVALVSHIVTTSTPLAAKAMAAKKPSTQ